MAATGFTPISLYYTTTASATPSASNLVAGELALNTTDEKLYFKNAAGTVKLLASNAATTPTAPGGSNTQVQFNNSGAFGGSSNLTWNGSTFAITGAASLSGDLTQSSTSGRITYSNATTSGNGGLQNNTGGSYVLLYPSTHATKSNHTDIAGTNINFVVGGNIATVTSTGLGIGTTSPSIILTVGAAYGGTANAESRGLFQAAGNSYLTIGAGASSDSGVLFADSGSNNAGFVGYNHSTNAMTFGTSSNERGRFDSSGNLGVGTSSPSYRLQANFTEPATTSRNGFFMNTSATNSDVALFRTGPTHSYAGVGASQWWLYHYNSLAIGSDSASAVITFVTNAAERARISAAGGFSVGTTADPGAGAIYATGNITAYYSSDIKFKENVRDIPDALATVNAIGGKLFDWTDEYIESKGGADGYFVQKADFGVVAQDVQKVFPIAVRTRDDGSLAVDYEKLGALAFAALVELTKRVEALEAK